MRVFDLCCTADHRFEGWFASEDDFVAQTERRLTACPICGSTEITRLPSAPRVRRPGAAEPPGGRRDDDAPSPAVPARATAPDHQAAWLAAVRQVIATTDDVGERFPEQARRMHYGEAAPRPIRGRASAEEAIALAEEGVPVMPLPIPDVLKQRLQ